MSVRLQVSALVFMMAQACCFGVGAILVLATPLSEFAMRLMPWVVVVSTAVSLPTSWILAGRIIRTRSAAAGPRVKLAVVDPVHG